VKLIENDYAVIRKFRGRSSLRTYLTVVVHRVVIDRRIAAWGKWRPSAEARRLGPAALLFERLIGERGVSFETACCAVQGRYGTNVSGKTLEALAARLAARGSMRRRQRLDVRDIEGLLVDPADPASALLEEGRQASAKRAAAVLARELEALPPADRRLIHQRFFEGASIVSLARDTGVDQKLLYRRMVRLFTTLRRRLEGRGLTNREVRELLAHAQ
jgi:RNA polymerase sigma factor for flagellar operon FliA